MCACVGVACVWWCCVFVLALVVCVGVVVFVLVLCERVGGVCLLWCGFVCVWCCVVG